MEVLVVGNTAYVDDDFCAKAFPGDHVQVVAAQDAYRDESSPHSSWKELLQHLDQAYEFDRMVYLSNYLTPHTDTVGDIELLRSVFRACAGRRVQLLYVAGPAGAEGATDAAGRTGKGIIAHAANDLCRYYAAREGVQTKILRVPFLYTASAALEDPFLVPLFDACSTGSVALQGAQDAAFPLLCAEELAVLVRRIFDSWDGNFETLDVADTFQGLFYEPSNWLPFIAYFVVGAVCGYVQLRNSEAIRAERDQNELVRNRNTFLTQLYHDAIEDKRAYRRQIVGRHDSFGKIFAVTQELDVLNPRDIYRKCCELLGEILENDSVAIYHVSGGAFARLVAASPAIAEDAVRSLTLEQLAPLLGDGGRSNLWVNRELTPGLPMFGYAIERDGAPAVLIFVRSAAENQMTLYYQNLFRILCGLVESALGRAFDYEAVAQDKRCVDGTCVLKQAAFGQELAAEQALADSKMGSFLLLRVVPGVEPVGELVGAIGSAIRESDAAGLVDGDVLYLLMRQAKACDLPIIRERLSAKHIVVEPVDGEDIVELLQHISYTGDGEGGAA